MASVDTTRTNSTHWRAGLPILRNGRVYLRELQPSDAPALYGIAHLPEVARHSWPAPPNVAAFEQYIEWASAERASGKYVSYGIVPTGGSAAVGLFELRPLQPHFFRAELGVLIDPSHWGSGVFSSAASLLVRFAFDVIGVHRIEARTNVDNARGNAALGKIGARAEGRLRAAFVRDSDPVDQNLWAIVAGLDVPRSVEADIDRGIGCGPGAPPNNR